MVVVVIPTINSPSDVVRYSEPPVSNFFESIEMHKSSQVNCENGTEEN